MIVGRNQYFKAGSLDAVALSARRHPVRLRLPLAANFQYPKDFHRRSGESA